MASKKQEYEFTTIKTGAFSSGKVKKYLKKGWEVVASERYGYSGNRITLRRSNPKYRPEPPHRDRTATDT